MNVAQATLPTSVGEAQHLLKSLSLPILTPEMLKAVGHKEGITFKQALVDAVNQNPNGEQQFKYLKAVITACSPVTRQAITSLGFDVPDTGTLIDLSKQEGPVFAGAVRCLMTQGAEPASVEASGTYLRKLLDTSSQAPLNGDRGQRPPSMPPQQHSGGESAQRTQSAPPPSRPVARQEAPPPPNNVARLPTRQDAAHQGDPASTAGPTAEAEASTDGRKFLSFHLYGGKAALCFSLDTTRKGNFPTVRIEAAPAKGEKSYDWDKKVSFQLTLAELPLVFGALYGFTPKIELSGHGETNDKTLAIEDQGAKFFISMRVRGGGVFAVPVLPKDTFAIMAMIFTQMKASSPVLSDNQLMALTKRVCEKTAAPVPYQRAASNG